LVFAIVFGGLLADLVTKSLVFQWLGAPGPFAPNQKYWIWENVLGFETSLNEGALFGMGQGLWIVFAAASVIASVVVVGWLFFYHAICDWLLTLALSSVLAGILGNLYDRLGLPGLRWNFANDLHNVGDPVHAVRDWILVMLGSYHWPNFNIADSLLVCGACLLMFHAFYRSEPSATC
jgi:signal peptidase II